MTEYLTPGKAAEKLKVSRWTILRWIEDGRFEGVAKGGFGQTSPNKIPVDSVKAVASQLNIEWSDSGQDEEE